MKSTKSNTGVRYDDAFLAKLRKFLATGSNQAAKKEFGCSAHFAGKVRADAKIPFADSVAKPVKKTAAPKGKAKSAADKAVAAVKGSKAKKGADLL